QLSAAFSPFPLSPFPPFPQSRLEFNFRFLKDILMRSRSQIYEIKTTIEVFLPRYAVVTSLKIL
ncbi:MAG: hypothetical protein HC930_04505, partial [Hydrococcus sp. SU_1_0]|nr:hypothetical protein [Hydrococcus sp. SU_1_0]